MANSGGFSSKRLIGLCSYFVCLGLLIYATIVDKQIPDFANMILITSSSLLGLDIFKGLFKKSED